MAAKFDRLMNKTSSLHCAKSPPVSSSCCHQTGRPASATMTNSPSVLLSAPLATRRRRNQRIVATKKFNDDDKESPPTMNLPFFSHRPSFFNNNNNNNNANNCCNKRLRHFTQHRSCLNKTSTTKLKLNDLTCFALILALHLITQPLVSFANAQSSAYLTPSAAECFNYEDGDMYQEENACQCVVFQGPSSGSFVYELQSQDLADSASSTIKQKGRQGQQLRCVFYLFLADLGQRVQVELENVATSSFKLVPVPSGGTEARNDAASYCGETGKLPITSTNFHYSVRVFTELMRPEINAYDNFQYVLCRQDGGPAVDRLVFLSQDRIVALQMLQFPLSNYERNPRLDKLVEIRGRFSFASNSNPISVPTYPPPVRVPQWAGIDSTVVPIAEVDDNRYAKTTRATRPPPRTPSTTTTTARTTPTTTRTTTTTTAMTRTPSMTRFDEYVATIAINVGGHQQQTTPPPAATVTDDESEADMYTMVTPESVTAADDQSSDSESSIWFVPDCDRNLTYTGSGNAVGIISSPGYPDNYPMPGTYCKYSFSAGGAASKVRVQITFVDFDLKSPSERGLSASSTSRNNPAVSCDQMDHIRISFPAAPAQPLKFCGKTRPYAVMSPTSSLELFFIAEPMANLGMPAPLPTDMAARGYQLQYRFIVEERVTDLTSSSDTLKQDNENREGSGCEFKFRSIHATNGSFSSINHPGFYPRNFKCAYHFIGRVNERVMLIFGFFDVRSSSPDCADGDYIQIEYPMASRTDTDGRQKLLLMGAEGNQIGSQQRQARYCSTRRPGSSIFSTWPHLLLTFVSDGRDDGRGFDAYFQFVAADEASIHQQQAGAQRLQSSSTSQRQHESTLLSTSLTIIAGLHRILTSSLF